MDGDRTQFLRLRDQRLDAELSRDWLDRERARDRLLENDRQRDFWWLGAERLVNRLRLEGESSRDRWLELWIRRLDGVVMRSSRVRRAPVSWWRALTRSTTMHHFRFFGTFSSSTVTVGRTANPHLDLFVYLIHCHFCSQRILQSCIWNQVQQGKRVTSLTCEPLYRLVVNSSDSIVIVINI